MSEQRYREAEARLHEMAELRAEEVWVDLPSIGCRARVLVAGEPDGDPILFLTGGPDGGGSTWSFAAARLTGVRALLLDRPGTGLSPRPPDLPDAASLATYVADLTKDVLDALAVDRATLVGCSFGGYSALRSAGSHPDRVTGVYLAGCPAFVPGWTPPGFFTALRTPVLGRLIPRLPASRPGARMSLKMLGHQRSLAEGRLPDSLVDWVTAWQAHTATMPNDAAMIRSCGSWLGGFDASLDLDPRSLARVSAPCHVLVGTDDVVGGAAVAERLASLLPTATVEVWDGAGHLPWYDAPARFADSFAAFRSSTSDRGRADSL